MINFINLRDKDWDVQNGERVRVAKETSEVKASSYSQLTFMAREKHVVDIFDLEHTPMSELKKEPLMAEKARDVAVPRPRKNWDPSEINPYIFTSLHDSSANELQATLLLTNHPRDSEHASTIFAMLASSGSRLANKRLLEIAMGKGRFSQEAKEALLFVTNADAELASAAVSKMPKVEDLHIVAYLLSQISGSVAEPLIQPYMEKFSSLKAHGLTGLLLGIGNLGANLAIPSVFERLVQFLYSDDHSVQSAALQVLLGNNCGEENKIHVLLAARVNQFTPELLESVAHWLERINCKSSAVLKRAVDRRKHDLRDSEPWNESFLDRKAVVGDNITSWNRPGEAYDSIHSMENRNDDVKTYPHHNSILWAKILGTSDLNGRILAGSFAGSDKEVCQAEKVFL